MRAAAWLRRYAAHPDPATAATNVVALVVASNGPFYPLYVLALIGWDHTGAWLTMLASPLFLVVPALSRASPRAGRAALPLIDITNTVVLPLGRRIALVRAGTAFWNEKVGPGVSKLCGNE
jgi:hypothetical protein